MSGCGAPFSWWRQATEVRFVLQTLIVLGQITLGFYGFWLIWRVLLPILPGPPDAADRVAPFVCYFTDPFVKPLARRLHLRAHRIAALALLVVAAAQVGLQRLSAAL